MAAMDVLHKSIAKVAYRGSRGCKNPALPKRSIGQYNCEFAGV